MTAKGFGYGTAASAATGPAPSSALRRVSMAVVERARESRRGGGPSPRGDLTATVEWPDAPSLAGLRDVDRYVYNPAENEAASNPKGTTPS